jgi:hypothetical protein
MTAIEKPPPERPPPPRVSRVMPYTADDEGAAMPPGPLDEMRMNVERSARLTRRYGRVT